MRNGRNFFFGEHRPGLALADAIALEGMIFSYIKAARKVDRAAANAFIPYAAWVAFRSRAQRGIARLNPRRGLSSPIRPAIIALRGS